MEVSVFGKQYCISKFTFITVMILLILGSGILGYFLNEIYQPFHEQVVEKKAPVVLSAADGNPREAAENSETTGQPEQSVEKIKVYVTGCVDKPGVVTLNKGAIIEDAITSAGGATKQADMDNINLAYKLEENTMLRIKAKPITGKVSASAEAKTPESSGLISKADSTSGIKQGTNGKQAGTSADTAAIAPTAAQKMNSGVDIISDSLGAVVPEEQAADVQGASQKSKLVNINKATQAELEGLPNVGPATAKAIIDYREKNGEFKKITDIMKITGIKQKTFDKIKDYICI